MRSFKRVIPGVRLGCTLVLALAIAGNASGSFVTFESGQVRPLALSADGLELYAVNTPDNRLEIFGVDPDGLTHTGSVPVGLEPVAVAVRTPGEVWVVNHLSDSVSVVDIATRRVMRTILVGDEPRDIVFAGPGPRAFITSAHRGQNSPFSPELTTPTVGRADVWVIGGPPGYSLIDRVVLFGDTPRALAVSGNTVYAGVFHSGNRSTALSEGVVCNGGEGASSCSNGPDTFPGGLPAPNTNVELVPQPEVGLIVKYSTRCVGGTTPGISCTVNPDCGGGGSCEAHWYDRPGASNPRNWDVAVRFALPDFDVFAFDATTLVVSDQLAGVGTVLFNMAVNPVSGKVYVSNTEARNEVRFEGPGVFGGSTVRGHLHEARVTVIDGGTVAPRHLNKHITYSMIPDPDPDVNDKSLSTPHGMAVTSDGSTLYVAAFGSSKIGVFSTAALENDSFVPDDDDHIPVNGGGPTGVLLNAANTRLYVLTRFDNSITVIDTATRLPLEELSLYNPEPASVVEGRPFLYDARFTSSNGEASCSSCHVFGDFDSLGWDLGNPDDVVTTNPNPIRVFDPFGSSFDGFHPMKGPMTTQSLRGMANHGPMHWRGDRTGGYVDEPLNEDLAFKAFNVAFAGLLGRGGPLQPAEMQAFTDFILQVTYPPNPIRALDNSLTADEMAGRNFYFNNAPSDFFQPCNGCHVLDPEAGFFGSDGFSSFENEPQFLKIPHLRNMCQKVGMFGMPFVFFFNSGNNGFQGNQVRGFGFLHDGSVDTMFRFHNAVAFNKFSFGAFNNPLGFEPGPAGDPQRRQVEAFMFAFDSDMAPIVGQQATLTNSNELAIAPRLDLMMERAAEGECDVTVKGRQDGLLRGWYRQASGLFRSDRAAEPLLTEGELRIKAAFFAGRELTYTCVPPGSGARIGVDRDEDGVFDRDELDAGTDPADPTMLRPVVAKKVVIKNAIPENERRNRVLIRSKDATIGSPLPGGASDPSCGQSPSGTVKATLTLASTTSGQSHTTNLPCQNWSLIGDADGLLGYRYRDRELDDGTVKSVFWKRGKFLKLQLKGSGPSNLSYDLQVGVSQDPVDVTFTSGESQICMQCNGANGKDGSDGKTFLGKDCAAPATCPP